MNDNNDDNELKDISSLNLSMLSSSKPRTKVINPINLILFFFTLVALFSIITLSFLLFNQFKELDIIKSESTSITNQINEAETKINSLKQSTTQINNSINIMKSQIDILMPTYNNLTFTYDKLKKYNDQLSKTNYKSKLLTSEEKHAISNMINPKVYSYLKLVYQSSIINNGDSAVVFHTKCNGIGPFVFIAKLENNMRVGGYSSLIITEQMLSPKDPTAFLFSLDTNSKYMIKNSNKAVSYNDLLFLEFGSGDFFITDEFMSNRFSYSNFPKSYGSESNNDPLRVLTGGMSNFRVLDFELFHVIPNT